MKLITEKQMEKLLENGRNPDNDSFEVPPVVKLYASTAKATWLLVSIDSKTPDLVWCVVDYGLGFVEATPVFLSQLENVRDWKGQPLQVDHLFTPTQTAAEYLTEGRACGLLKA